VYSNRLLLFCIRVIPVVTGLLVFFATYQVSLAQTFLNGDFENNSAIGDQINLTNAGYNAQMSNSTAFGTYGDMDIITSAVYTGGPQSGCWFVAFTGGGTDMISLQLSSNLIAGNSYTISFWDKADGGFTPMPFEIGVSTTPATFGSLVYTAPVAATVGVWTQRTFTFTSPITALYVTVSTQGVLGNWSQVDNFQMNGGPPGSSFLGPDTTVCVSPFTIDAGYPGSTYSWSTGATTQSINVTSSNDYSVTVNLPSGCATLIDTINVTFSSPVNVNLGNDTSMCTGQLLLLDVTTSGATYQWQNGATTSSITVNTTGLYWVDVTLNGCSDIDSINVSFTACGSTPASFAMPDTVCVGELVNIINNTVGGTTFNWSFDITTLNSTVNNTTVGNPGGQLVTPTYGDVVFDGTNYFMFISNYFSGDLIRWDFGSSLLNVPVATNLGIFGGILPPELEGIQIEIDGGIWYGYAVGGGANPVADRLVRLNFGASLSNVPTATNLGNISSAMNWPHQLEIFKDGTTWYGVTVNRTSNVMTIFDFGTTLANIPTASNTGVVGGMSSPINFALIKDYATNTWYGLVCNPVNSNLSFLTFGATINNAPIGLNIGNPGNLLNGPRAITLTTDCDELVGYVANENGGNLVKLSFSGGIGGVITPTNLGTFGGVLSNTHYMAPCWINGNFNVMSVNAGNSTVQRLEFFTSPVVPIPPSNLQTPPAFSFSSPGTYTVQLLVDEGMATQSYACQDITAIQLDFVDLGLDTTICTGQSLILDAGNPGASFIWSNASTTQTISVTNPGTYFVNVTIGGCSSADTITVSFVAPPVVNLGNDTILCVGQTLILNAGNLGSTYLWSTGATTQSINITSAGNFWVDVANFGCTVSDTINVSFVNSNFVNLGNDTTLCIGNTLILDVGVSGATYSWSTGAITQTISVSNAGTYSVTANDNGCIDGDTIVITTTPSPTVNLGADTVACNGTSITLDAGNAGMNYNWSNTLTTQQIQVSTSGNYSVTVTNLSGCTGTDAITVSFVNPPVVNLGNDTLLCVGEIMILDAGNSGASYNWNTGASTQTILVNYPDNNYWVEVDAVGCMTVDYIFITYNIPPVISLPGDTTICEGQTFVLTPGSGTGWTYQWSTNDQTSSITVVDPGTYSVTVSDPNGCTISDEMIIDDECEGIIFVPDAFTPNGDFLNEILFVRSNDVSEIIFLIFDRWGNKIFESASLSDGWDGTYLGKPMNPGVYVYMVKATFTSGNIIEKKGDVTLIR